MADKRFAVTTWFHPGETLQELLEERNLTKEEFARQCNLPEATISDFLQGKSSVTPSFAEILEKATKMPAKMWLGLQKGYDDYITTKKKKLPWAAAAL